MKAANKPIQASKTAIPGSLLLLCAGLLTAASAHAGLFGGPKTIAVDASGQVPGNVVSAQMATGGYVRGVTKIAVPVVAIAFESHAKARTSSISHGGDSTTTRTESLENHLLIDEKVLQDIADQAQAIVEADLRAQGFELLPPDAVDQEPRYAGIAKNGVPHVETKDNFMSGFAGNGVYNRWFTAGNRPFFGTGATGVFSDHSALVHLARDTGKTVVFYRFKVQFTEMDAKKNLFVSYVKGRNVLHMSSADAMVFTPANTMGARLNLDANLTAGTDFVGDVQELPRDRAEQAATDMGAALEALRTLGTVTTTSGKASGHYAIVADPAAYEDGSLKLIKAVSQQFAAAIKRGQK
jgi:hypothetical protein